MSKRKKKIKRTPKQMEKLRKKQRELNERNNNHNNKGKKKMNKSTIAIVVDDSLPKRTDEESNKMMKGFMSLLEKGMELADKNNVPQSTRNTLVEFLTIAHNTFISDPKGDEGRYKALEKIMIEAVG
tara:strand:- start:412 stop:792 length:381 start_codon:yes stop_codon:yes gene_type:complete